MLKRFSIVLVFIFSVVCCIEYVGATSLVYNIKTRRTFAANLGTLLGKDHASVWVTSAAPIVNTRSRHIVEDRLLLDVHEKNKIGGSIFDFKYVPNRNWWVEVTTAVAKETTHVSGSTSFIASRKGFDDLVFSGGGNFFPNKELQFSAYALAGFPLQRTVTPYEAEGTLVGTRFFSVGAGAEGSYSFISTRENMFAGLCQMRFVHFFSREWYPILPHDASIEPGNVTDLLLSVRYRYKKSFLEGGYNLSIFSQQAVHGVTETYESDLFLRNSGYVTVSHAFTKPLLLPVPLVIGAGMSVGTLKLFDTKLLSFWLLLSGFF